VKPGEASPAEGIVEAAPAEVASPVEAAPAVVAETTGAE
jgi:hypothetical protein